ncbi:MAG: aminodeoxychorismate lyase [Woeseiaceae bacterium]
MRVINADDGERVSAADRGLTYGDGCFETMRIADGGIPLLDWHAARLEKSIHQLQLTNVSASNVLDHVLGLVAKQSPRDWAKLILTRGRGGRGYAAKDVDGPTLILSTGLLTPIRQGMTVTLATDAATAQPVLAGLKHLSRLSEVMAANRCPQDADEQLMLDHQSSVISGVMHNIHIVREGQLLTPDLGVFGVAGVMRDWLLGHTEVLVQRVTIEDILLADEVLFSNGLRGIRNATSVCGHRLRAETPIGDKLRKGLQAAGFPQ